MKLKSTFVSGEHRYSLGVEVESGTYVVAIPVWRGIQASKSLLDQLKLGDTFSDPGYLSTTTSGVSRI